MTRLIMLFMVLKAVCRLSIVNRGRDIGKKPDSLGMEKDIALAILNLKTFLKPGI